MRAEAREITPGAEHPSRMMSSVHRSPIASTARLIAQLDRNSGNGDSASHLQYTIGSSTISLRFASSVEDA